MFVRSALDQGRAWVILASMAYLVLGNGGGRIRVPGNIAAARIVARELALYTGASVVLETTGDLADVGQGWVRAQFVKRGKCSVSLVTRNHGKVVRI